MAISFHKIVLDCNDLEAQAKFWTAAIGYELRATHSDYVFLAHPERKSPAILFMKVSETKDGKNRMHIDLEADDMEAEVKRLTDLGAQIIQAHAEYGIKWTIMQDPEGNEFCVAKH